MNLSEAKFQRKLFQDNKLSSLLAYFGLIILTLFVLLMADRMLRNFFRVVFVLSAILLILVTFLAATKVKKYNRDWNFFLIIFGFLLLVISLLIMVEVSGKFDDVAAYRKAVADGSKGMPTVYLSLLGRRINDISVLSSFTLVQMFVYPLLAGGLLLASGIHGLRQALLVGALRRYNQERGGL